MRNKYHVNPETGAPGLCRAKNGKCPYGGRSGVENHYSTFGEAQLAAQEMLVEKHGLLPSNKDERPENFDEQLREIKEMIDAIQGKKDIDHVNLEVKYNIRTTDDTVLLQDIIEGKTYIQEGWIAIGPALQNPNLPRSIINGILRRPKEYHIETLRWLATNPALTHEEIMKLVDTQEDLTVRSLALRNPSLKEEFAIDFVKNRKDELAKAPWYNMIDNSSLDYDKIFKEYHLRAIIDGLDTDDTLIYKINSTYPDFKNLYEFQERKKREKEASNG